MWRAGGLVMAFAWLCGCGDNVIPAAPDSGLGTNIDAASTTLGALVDQDPQYAGALGPLPIDDDEIETCSAWSGDDFDDGDHANWTSGTGVSVDTAIAADGSTASLRVADWATRPAYRHAAVQPTRVTVWSRVDLIEGVTGSNFVVFGDANTLATTQPSNYGIAYLYVSYGQWALSDGSAVATKLFPAVVAKWERFDFDLDWATKTFDLHVNGVLEVADFKFRTEASNDVSVITLFNLDPDAIAHYDEIVVTCP
jgi:hypothetical protein